MKKILLFLLLNTYLFSSSIYTLDNVKNVGIYFENKADFLGKEDKKKIKDYITKELKKVGFVFGKTDSDTIVLKINSKELDGTYFIHVSFALAEDVITKREGNIEALANTYLAGELIESDEPVEDTTEMVEFLLAQFIAAYKDDNEE